MTGGDIVSDLERARTRGAARRPRVFAGLPEFAMTKASVQLRLFLQNAAGGPQLNTYRSPGPAGSVRLTLEQERGPGTREAIGANDEHTAIAIHVPEMFRLRGGKPNEMTLASGDANINVRVQAEEARLFQDDRQAIRNIARDHPHTVLTFYDALADWLARGSGQRSYPARLSQQALTPSIETPPDAARFLLSLIHGDTARLNARVALPLNDLGRLSEYASYSFGLRARYTETGSVNGRGPQASGTLHVTPYPTDFLISGDRFEQARSALRSKTALLDLAGKLNSPESEAERLRFLDEQIARNLTAVFALARPGRDPRDQTTAALIRPAPDRRLLIYFRMRWEPAAAGYRFRSGVWFHGAHPGAASGETPAPSAVDALIDRHLKRIAVEYHRWKAWLI